MEDVQPLRSRTGRLTLVFLVFAAVALALGTALGNRPSDTDTSIGGPMEGQAAPEIAVDLFAGGTWRLSEHLTDDGRPLIVNLWASWCEPCREEIPELSEFASATPGYQVLGVAVRDSADAARALVDELEPTYPTGIDSTGRLRDRYVGFGLPSTFIIDGRGVITAQIEGPVTARLLRDLTTG